MPYRHTQRGTLIMLLCLVLAALDAAIALRTGQWAPIAVLIILIAIAFMFSSLTVEVNGGELRWHFGPGFRGERFKLDSGAARRGNAVVCLRSPDAAQHAAFGRGALLIRGPALRGVPMGPGCGVS
jgi:hypothetical protein